MKTKNCRPWWWWLNPWLYIKRRDAAYDVALDTLRELNVQRWNRQQAAKEAKDGR